MKHLILVSSVINCNTGQSVFTNEERLSQTIKTIHSIKTYLKNSYIVLIEGGNELSVEDARSLEEAGCDLLVSPLNATHLHKSVGELMLLKAFLSSQAFEELREQEFTHFGKLSGRYELTEKLNISQDLCTIKMQMDGTWSGRGICETRFYHAPFIYINRYENTIHQIIEEGILIDVEHSFFHYEVFPFDKTYSPSELGVTGLLAPTGEKIND